MSLASNFIFYCHANQNTGLGHLSRCLNIARALSRRCSLSKIYFYGDFDDFAISRIRYYSFTIMSKQESFTAGSVIICDDYKFSEFELHNLFNLNCKIVVIDDFQQYDYDFMSLIVNFRLEAEFFYKTRNSTCLGIGFFPFSAELKDVRLLNLNRPSKEDINKVVVFIGGTDHFDVGTKIISALDRVVSKAKVILITKNESSVSMYHNDLEVMPFVEDVSQVYLGADVVISGGGATKYEAGFCVIPNCAVSQTVQQLDDTKILAKHNLTYDLGLAQYATIDTLEHEIKKFILSRASQLSAFAQLYKTNSTDHLADEIFKVGNERI